jgi:hypothetical protein
VSHLFLNFFFFFFFFSPQLKWRLGEGQGEAIYELGVKDDGTLLGLTVQELEQSYATLQRMAKVLAAEVSVVATNAGNKGAHECWRVLVRELRDGDYIDVRVAVAGNVDAGKCLARDTPVLMHDGALKLVQHVAVGDFVLGDNSRPCRVLRTVRGAERLVRVRLADDDAAPAAADNGDNSFVCNVSHILSLKLADMPCVALRRGVRLAIVQRRATDGVVVALRLCTLPCASSAKARAVVEALRSTNDAVVVAMQRKCARELALRLDERVVAWHETLDVCVGDLLDDSKRIDADACAALRGFRSGVLEFATRGDAVAADAAAYARALDERVPDAFKYGSVAVRRALWRGVCATMEGGVLTLASAAVRDDVAFVARSLGVRCVRDGATRPYCGRARRHGCAARVLARAARRGPILRLHARRPPALCAGQLCGDAQLDDHWRADARHARRRPRLDARDGVQSPPRGRVGPHVVDLAPDSRLRRRRPDCELSTGDGAAAVVERDHRRERQSGDVL